MLKIFPGKQVRCLNIKIVSMKKIIILIILFFLFYQCRNKNDKIIYENDNIKEKCETTNGYKNGVCTLFFENGNISKISNWKNDTLDGQETEYFVSGVVKRDYSWNMGLLNGQVFEYFENGNLSKIGNWENGKRIGAHKEYYQNGGLKKYLNYYILEEDESYLNEVLFLSDSGDTLYDKSNFFLLDLCSDTLLLGDTLIARFNVVAPAFENSEFIFFFLPENDTLVRRIYSGDGEVLYNYKTILPGKNFLRGYIEEFLITEEFNDTLVGKSRYLYFQEPFYVIPD